MSILTRWSHHMTLAAKLWVAIATISAVMAGLGFWQVWALRKGEQALVDVFEGRLLPIRELKQIGDNYGSTMVLTARKVRAGTLPAPEGRARVQAAFEEGQRLWSRVRQDSDSAAEAEAIRRVEWALRDLKGPVTDLDRRLFAMSPDPEPLEALVAGPQGAELGRFLDMEFLPRVERVSLALTTLADLKEAEARSAVEATSLRRSRSESLAAWILGGSFLAALLLGWALSQELGSAVARLGAHVRRVAGGDLDRRLPTEGHDELTDLAAELNRMTQQLQETVTTLREREATQRSLLQSARTIIYTTGLDGRIQTFNLAAEQMLGFSADEMVGFHTPVRFHDPAELAARIGELNAQKGLRLQPGLEALTHMPRLGEVEQREWTYLRKDGTRFPGLAVACPIRNDEGRLLGFLTVVTDISAQKAAEQFQDRLQAVLDLTPDLVAMVEVGDGDAKAMAPSPRIVYTNKAFEPLRPVALGKGRDPEDFFSYLPPWAVQLITDEALPILLEQGHWRGEAAMIGPLGLEFPVDQVLIAHRNEQGRVTHISGIARDIRREKARERLLREREARLQAINRASPTGIFLMDTDGGVSYANPSFEAITGLLEEDLPFRDWMEAVHPHDHAALRTGWAEARLARRPFEAETRFLHTDGGLRWAQLLTAPVWDGDRFLGYVGCLMDVSDVKQATLELQASEARALAASQAKSSFLSNMSHELRTPLNAILGYAQLMTRSPDRSPQDQEHLGRIHNAGEHLLGLINDVLSIAKIESGKLTLNPTAFDCPKLFQTLHDVVAVRAQSKGLVFDMEVGEGFPERLEGDEGKLRQVLVNLLGNAVKFTTHGRVVLRARYAEGSAQFEVEDTGPGISEADQAHLFQSFFQVTGAAAAEGSGLGLSISRAMVRLMGGDISLRSQLGQGSTFAFQIPLAVVEGHAAVPTRGKVLHVAAGQRAFKLLVADDRPENRDLLCHLLSSVGLSALAARDGAEALELWQEWHPDLIWMDIRMPRMDGFTALREIRKREGQQGHPATKVVAITASVMDQDRASLTAKGFDDFVGKPFREEQVFDVLTEHLGLQFVTEEPRQADLETLSREALLGQPQAWLEAFREAVAGGDTPSALALADALEDTTLAQSLRQRLKSYRLEELLHLMEA